MTTTIKTTDQLQAGDVVLCHGARVLLAGEPKTWAGHAGTTVYAWQEMEIISGEIWSMEHLATWTVQGNDLARWDVES